jgi:predicted MFS family arabinose efflux permease
VGLLLRRIWLALAAVMAIVLATLSILAVLQHDAILSNLIRQRLSVVVGSTAEPFRSVVELGLPVSMMRNATELLLRARETDPLIKAVHLINPSGIVVDSTLAGDVEPMPREIVRALADSADGRWTAETDADLISGYSILDEGGSPVGAVVATYPRIELEQRSRAIRQRMGLVSAILLVLFSVVSYLALRVRLRGPISELRRIEKQLDGSDEQAPDEVSVATASFPALSEMLERASLAYRSALSELAQFCSPAPEQPGSDAAASVRFVGIAETDLARNIAGRLMPLVAAMVFGSALALAYVAYLGIGESFSPEIAKRTELIGTVANANIQRAIEAGVPLDRLVGGQDYFQDLTQNLPEISYLGILPGKPILEIGRKRSAAEGVSEFPLVLNGETIGTIVTETDPLYFAAQFRDMLLDLGVVLLVIVLFAFELVVVMMTSAVTLPIDGLQHVAGLQAASDFSKRLVASGVNVISRLADRISERAVRLNGMFAEAWRSAMAGETPEERARLLEALGRRFGLRRSGAEVLRFCSLSDVRLPLFLFAMADELPLSFFSLFARDADNPITWISPGIVIGLPLAAYLLATLFGAPLARPLERRFGYRNLFLAGAGMCMLANVGLFAASNIIHLIACLAINGLGFILASLSCQDYVLDMLPPAVRSRSIGLIRTAMFSGVFAGTALGGIIADRMGQRPVFIVCAVVMAVSASLIWRYVPHFRAGSGKPGEQEHTRLSFNLLAPMRSARFAAIAFGIIVPLEIVDHVFISYLLSLQMDALGSSAAGIGRAMMCFFLMLIIGGTIHDKVPRRYSNPALVAFASSVVSGVMLLVAAAFPSSASMFLAAAGAGLGLGLAGGPQAVLVMDLAEGRLSHLGSSAVLGTMRLLERGGAVAGLVLTGMLTGYVGYSGAVGAIGCLVLFGAIVFALLHTAGRRSMREKVS